MLWMSAALPRLELPLEPWLRFRMRRSRAAVSERSLCSDGGPRRIEEADTPRERLGFVPEIEGVDLGWKKIPAGRPSGLCINIPLAVLPPSFAAVSLKYSRASAGIGLLTACERASCEEGGDVVLGGTEPALVLFGAIVASAGAGVGFEPASAFPLLAV